MDDAACEATPIPLPARAPRSDQRFTIAGESGVWKRVRDLTTDGEPYDLSRPFSANECLGTLGDRLVLFESDSGSEI